MSTFVPAPQFYREAAAALGLPVLPEEGNGKVRSAYWHIEDVYTIPGVEGSAEVDAVPETTLYLLQYKKEMIPLILTEEEFSESEKTALLTLRGLIIDGDTYRVVAPTFGYTPTVTIDKLSKEPMTVTGQMGETFTFDPTKITYEIYYQGTVIRRWKYKGVAFTSTFRRIQVDNSSRWGAISFLPTYRKLKGPTDAELFGDQESNYCHIFMLTHSSLYTASKMNIGAGWLIYLRAMRISEEAGSEPPFWQPALRRVDTHDEAGNEALPYPMGSAEEEESFLWATTPFGPLQDTEGYPGAGLKLANRILSRGYSEASEEEVQAVDYRVRPGEALMCTFDNGRRLMKIASTAFHWRAAVMGNDPNLYRRFLRLIDQVQPWAAFPVEPEPEEPPVFDGNDDRKYTYAQLFPYLGTPTVEELHRQGDRFLEEGAYWLAPAGVTQISIENEPPERRRDLLLRNLSLVFMMAIPISQVHLATGSSQPVEEIGPITSYYEHYQREQEALLAYFVNNFEYLWYLLLPTTPPEQRLEAYPRFRRNGGPNPGLNTAGLTLETVVRKAREVWLGPITDANRVQAMGVITNSLRRQLRSLKGDFLYALSKALWKQDRVKEIPVGAELPPAPMMALPERPDVDSSSPEEPIPIGESVLVEEPVPASSS